MSIRVEVLSGFDLRLGENDWPFAKDERKRIDAHWDSIVTAIPKLWNGDVLICTDSQITEGILSARFAVTDFASFIAWRDWGWPDRSVVNCFGVSAVKTADGALVFGVMGPHTLNAGRLYPPAGSLERRDVKPDGTVDIRQSMVHELAEETGLDASLASRGRLVAISEGQRLAVVEELLVPHDFTEIETIFQRHTHNDAAPELSAIEAIRSSAQIDSRMPPYAQELARLLLS